jgi:hypothetical protein
MRELVALTAGQQSASERLRGVSWANQVESSDGQVLAALLDSVNHDPNVNVRLAAADALRTFAMTSPRAPKSQGDYSAIGSAGADRADRSGCGPEGIRPVGLKQVVETLRSTPVFAKERPGRLRGCNEISF